MENSTQNKFEMVHSKLIVYCEKCNLDKKKSCGLYNLNCTDFSRKFKNLYFNILYPFHPCKECPELGSCDTKEYCQDRYVYNHMRLVAECEIKNDAVYFSKHKIPVVAGPVDIITKEYLISVDYFRNNIDFEVTDEYTKRLKKEPFYADLLSTVRKYIEYCNKHRKADSDAEFIDEFF